MGRAVRPHLAYAPRPMPVRKAVSITRMVSPESAAPVANVASGPNACHSQPANTLATSKAPPVGAIDERALRHVKQSDPVG
jgi:hypothetical protein